MGLVKYFLLILPWILSSQENLRPSEAPALLEIGGKYIPWFTGTLLTPSGYIAPPLHFKIQPFVFVENRYGRYNEHWHSEDSPHFLHMRSLLVFKMGLVKNVDFTVIPEWIYRHTEGISSTGFGDLSAGFDFQLFEYSKGSWLPAIRLILREIFPTGKYQNLSPSKQRTDVSGRGSFASFIGFGFSRLFHFEEHHFLETRMGISYIIPAPAHVKGFNAYGGAFGTDGTAFPGQRLITSFGLQYTLTQRWVLAMDLKYEHENRSRFKGNPGFVAPGEKAIVTRASLEQFVILPQIEYNWSADVGIVAGPWFAFAGRNSEQFGGGAISFTYYH